MTEVSVDPAVARKRRKEIMQSLRSEDENGKPAAPETVEAVAAAAAAAAVAAVEEAEDAQPPPKKRKAASKKKEGAAAKKAAAKKNESDNKKRTQVRYDPEVPMDKEQLAAWRREARRVRNRESAAASRQRIRDRITELETEVGQWKERYTQAMERLQQLEQMAASQDQSTSS